MSYLQNNAQYAPGTHPAVETGTRKRWAEERDAGNRIPPHPAPEVIARPATASEVPRTALSLRVAAEKAGWAVAVTYARGTLMYADGSDGGRIVETIALRMRHPDGRRAVAVWEDGSAEGAWVRLPGQWPTRRAFSAGKSKNPTVKDFILEPVRHLVLAS